MKNLTSRLGALGVILIAALASPTSSCAMEFFEGVWTKTQAECRDEEGPNTRTVIDLSHLIDGNPTPIFDQYENHCRIVQNAVVGNGTNLSVVCFEFWEDFAKGIGGREAIIRLSPGQKSTLKIDGTPYHRCPAKLTRVRQR